MIQDSPHWSISVVIPALNEEEHLPKLLNYINRQASNELLKEIIVVDGQSDDRTVEVARREGANVVTARKIGRASQMNKGAEIAKGELLYFLHSDTYPPPDFVSQICRAMQNGYQAGCFQLDFDIDHPMLRFYSWFTRYDLNAFRFGDQSLYVEESLFNKIGGFDENLKVMEDNEIIKRIKRQASFIIMEDQVITSARRYLDNGIFKLQLIFTLIYLLHHLGISQEVLLDLYKNWIK